MNEDGPVLLIILVALSFADSTSAKILGQDPDKFEGTKGLANSA